jgi:DNA-directed RNA polymerase subunit RPC12/RpoP
MTNAETLAAEPAADQNSIVAACPACAFARSHRSKRQFWERISGLRAFRCTVCSHRFSKMDRDAEPWRTLGKRMAGARTWMSQIGPAVAELRSRRRAA